MQTFDQFMTTWNGKGIDFDHYYGYQCVDLYRKYCADVLGVPQSPGVSGAVKIWDTYLSKYFYHYPNTPTGVPQKGDIVIWKFYPGVTGLAGHVGIFVEGNVNRFVAFNQNYPTGTLCHNQSFSYKGVVGWLRKK